MTAPDLSLNPHAVARLQPIGDAAHCVVVDDFLDNPQSVVDFAVRHAAGFEIPPNSYPGPVMDIAPTAVSELHRYVRTRMSRHFPFLRGGIDLSVSLSMTTLQPDELSNLQRLCHTDPRTRVNRANYAGLLYLFENADLGGTGFYRWKAQALIEQATALELKNPDEALRFLERQFPTYRQPPCYITGSNEIAELVDVVAPRFNRWIFYPGDIPHSAHIVSPEKLSHDYARGRLTLNCFASVIPG